MLSTEWLLERRRQLSEQIILNQGAVQMIDHILAELAEPDDADLTVEQFAELVGGPGAQVSIAPNGQAGGE